MLSGAGIGDLYDFVRTTAGAAEPAWLAAQLASDDRNAAISQAALDGSDPACVRALEMFVEILGAEAGNLALRGLATGGVVIGGGIPPKILPALQHAALARAVQRQGPVRRAGPAALARPRRPRATRGAVRRRPPRSHHKDPRS